MNQGLRQLKKIKVLGYPFAGGQGKSGVEQTPSWLQNQLWFRDLAKRNNHIEYEEIKVSSKHSNLQQPEDYLTSDSVSEYMSGASSDEEVIEAKNTLNVMSSSINLRNQTFKALQEGYYPIVLGGDHSQAIGSIAGMKRFMPDTKIIWVDAHIDANTPDSSPSRNAHGMPLAYLTGQINQHKHWSCVDMRKDVCYFGIRSYEDEEAQFISDNNVLVFEPKDCQSNKMNKINAVMNRYYHSVRGYEDKSKYWISFDIDSIDANQFMSTGTAEGNGLSIEFVSKLFETFTARSIGMDLTEVNFELTAGQMRQTDEQTFREIFEHICHQVNQPAIEEDMSFLQQESYNTVRI